MRENFKIRWNNLVQSQRGAALLMVLLVTVFVVIMGSSVMFTSYNSYIMRLVDREGVDTFYDTEELTDLVRVSVQDAASEALQTAYTRVMSEYAFIQAAANFQEDAVQDAAQDKFNEYFIEELARYYTEIPQYDDYGKPEMTTPSGGSTSVHYTEPEHLFRVEEYKETGLDMNGTSGSVTGSLSTNALQGILNSLLTNEKDSVTVSGGPTASESSNIGATGTDNATIKYPFDNDGGSLGGVANFTYTFGDDGYPRLTIKDVTVSYVTEGGYQTNITTDIIIEMPMFIHTGDISQSDLSSSGGGTESQMGLPFDNASSIGKLWVKSSVVHTDGLLVTGDIYGGTFFIYAPDDNSVDPRKIVFSHGKGRLITHDGMVPVDKADSGNVYSTGVNLGDDYVSLDGIVIHGGTSFTSESTSEIWTNSVSVRDGSDVTLAGERGTSYNPYLMPERNEDGSFKLDGNGDKVMIPVTNLTFGGTFIKNDVTILGGIGLAEIDSAGVASRYNNISNIILSGDIFGFSMGDTGDSSSAIVMNGDDISLDMSGLRRIMLGGTTYLQVGRTTGFTDESGNSLQENSDLDKTAEYEMGQSIAATPDALAYMVPYNAISGLDETISSNPAQIEGSFTGAKIDTSQLPTWVKGILGENPTPQVISRTYGDTRLVYFFYQFNDDADRAKYISEYIKYTGTDGDTTYKGYFENNLGLFVNMTNRDTLLADSAAAGVVYYMGESGLEVMNTSLDDDSKKLLSEYDQYFSNAAVTLWPEVPIHSSVPGIGYATYDLDTDQKGGFYDDDDNYIENVGNITMKYPNNPFDYYVNMRGDNLWIDYAYTHDGGTNLDNTVQAGLKATTGTTADMYAYFDHDRDGNYNPYYGNVPEGYVAPNTKQRRIGLADWATDTYGGDTTKYYEFYLDGEVVALYKANGMHWGRGGVDYDTKNSLGTGDYENVVMLISRSGINIHDDFEGLAFSETGIALVGAIDSISMGFETILNAYCDNPDYPTGTQRKYLYEFFRNLDLTYDGSDEEGSDPSVTPGVSEDDAKVNWSPNDLVYYENWEKH